MNEEQISNEVKKIEKLLRNAENSIEKARRVLDSVKRKTEKSYEDVPGVEGTFEGLFLSGEDGKKYPIPPNYSAKSMLVFGDKLKMVEENGKTLFKQIDKVDRVEVEGMITKKDGKWHVLTEAGSHEVLETAADYRKAEVNDEALVLLPKNNPAAPFAALDKVIKDGGEVIPASSGPEDSDNTQEAETVKSKTKKEEPSKKPEKEEKPKKSDKKVVKKDIKASDKKKTTKKKEKKTESKAKSGKEESDLGDDDLR